MAQTGMVAGGPLTDVILLGVLCAAVPRDAVDEAVEATGKAAKRSGGKLPPHVMVYFAMALALFADDDYEEGAARLGGALRGRGWWGEGWGGGGAAGGGHAGGGAGGGVGAAPGVVLAGGGPGRRRADAGGV